MYVYYSRLALEQHWSHSLFILLIQSWNKTTSRSRWRSQKVMPRSSCMATTFTELKRKVTSVQEKASNNISQRMASSSYQFKKKCQKDCRLYTISSLRTTINCLSSGQLAFNSLNWSHHDLRARDHYSNWCHTQYLQHSPAVGYLGEPTIIRKHKMA